MIMYISIVKLYDTNKKIVFTSMSKHYYVLYFL